MSFTLWLLLAHTLWVARGNICWLFLVLSMFLLLAYLRTPFHVHHLLSLMVRMDRCWDPSRTFLILGIFHVAPGTRDKHTPRRRGAFYFYAAPPTPQHFISHDGVVLPCDAGNDITFLSCSARELATPFIYYIYVFVYVAPETRNIVPQPQAPKGTPSLQQVTRWRGWHERKPCEKVARCLLCLPQVSASSPAFASFHVGNPR